MADLDGNPAQFNSKGREQWNRKAKFWDSLHGDSGNSFHQELIEPSVLQLLQPQQGERILDIACGNGVLARKLVSLGAEVVAVDFSEELIDLAKDRGEESISYRVVDATDVDALTSLGQFDGITCTMALMDMPTIEPLLEAVAQMLLPGGRFVFATSHPAFNSTNPTIVAEQSDQEGKIHTEHALKISSYFGIPPALAVGAKGEPSSHYLFHRTLQEILTTAFDAGLVMDGILEPCFPAELAEPDKLKWWVNTPSIPPVLTCRLISPGSQ